MKPINREILRIALPSILANITVPLVGMVDIAVAGHLDGGFGAAAFIGAISVGSMLFDLLYWNFYFLRAGTGGLTAQAYGRSDWRQCGILLMRSIIVALGIALLVLLIQWPLTKLAFLVVDCSPEVRKLALDYFFIRILAAPATLSLMSLRGWFIGMQDSVSSMLTDLVVNAVNIVLSIVLTLGMGSWPGIGFKGIAIGTVVAQYSGFAFAVAVVLLRYRRKVFATGLRHSPGSGVADMARYSAAGCDVRRPDFRAVFKRSEMRSFFTLNADLFVRSMALTSIYIGYTVISSHYGDLMLASGAIMMKLLMLFSYFTDGFAYAGEALTGKYIGRGSVEMVRSSVRHVFIWSMGIGVAFIFIYWLGGVPMLRVLTSDSAVVEACRQFIPWLILMPPLGCAAFAWDGIYEGATASRPVRNAMVGAMISFFGLWFILSRTMLPEGNNAFAIHLLMAAYFAHLLFRTVYLSILYRRTILRF